MTAIQDRSVSIDRKIFDHDYYTAIYKTLLKSKGYTSDMLSTLSDDRLIYFWNSFWFALPDSASIRRVPFFEICELCESSEVEDDDEDDDGDDDIPF